MHNFFCPVEPAGREQVSCRGFLYSSRRRIPPVNQNGFSRAKIVAPGRIGRRRGLSSAGPHAPTQITVICTTTPPSTPPRTVGTKITTWVISTPSSSRARPRSSRASRARSALTSSKSRGPRAARATHFARSVSPPRAPGRLGSWDADYRAGVVQRLERPRSAALVARAQVSRARYKNS